VLLFRTVGSLRPVTCRSYDHRSVATQQVYTAASNLGDGGGGPVRFGTFVVVVLAFLFAGATVVYFLLQRPTLVGFDVLGGLVGSRSTAPESTSAESGNSTANVKLPRVYAPVIETVARVEPSNRPGDLEELTQPLSTSGTTDQPVRPTGSPVIGMDRDTLRRTAGEPTVRIMGLEEGRTVETYVYSRTGHDANTYARLIDGQVVAVETLPH